MDQQLLDTLNQAAQSHQYVLLAVALLALIVPAVLHALGKDVPLASPVLKAAVEIVKGMKVVDRVPPPANKPEGVAAVVPVVEDLKDKGSGPQP